jgi:hypothetical protein
MPDLGDTLRLGKQGVPYVGSEGVINGCNPELDKLYQFR